MPDDVDGLFLEFRSFSLSSIEARRSPASRVFLPPAVLPAPVAAGRGRPDVVLVVVVVVVVVVVAILGRVERQVVVVVRCD